jgi:hypothetical protein
MTTNGRWAIGAALMASLACAAPPAEEARVPSEPTGCAPVKERAGTAPTYRCTLRSGEPPVMVRLVFDSAARVVDHVELRHQGDSLPFQVLVESQEEAAPDGVFPLGAQDFDADGRLELTLFSMSGATGNTLRHVWRWEPARGRFVRDSTLSTLASPVPIAGRPCVRSRYNGGHAGLIYGEAELCRERGQWVTVREETQAWHEPLGAYLRERKAIRGKELVAVGTDTVRP